MSSLHSREFLFQDGIYPDPAPGGFDSRHFLENVSLNVIDMNNAQQGPGLVASLKLQMLSPFLTIRTKEMLRSLTHRDNVGSTLK